MNSCKERLEGWGRKGVNGGDAMGGKETERRARKGRRLGWGGGGRRKMEEEDEKDG